MHVDIVLADPLVPHHIEQRDPSLSALAQQPRDEVLGQDGHVVGVVDLERLNLLVRQLRVLRLERRLAHEELVAQDAQAPLVHRRVVRLALHHLWRQIVQRAAHCLAPDGKKTKLN